MSLVIYIFICCVISFILNFLFESFGKEINRGDIIYYKGFHKIDIREKDCFKREQVQRLSYIFVQVRVSFW